MKPTQLFRITRSDTELKNLLCRNRSDTEYAFEFFRRPHSKKRRILNKWRGRQENWRLTRTAMLAIEELVARRYDNFVHYVQTGKEIGK
jgi:hypothetical protein